MQIYEHIHAREWLVQSERETAFKRNVWTSWVRGSDEGALCVKSVYWVDEDPARLGVQVQKNMTVQVLLTAQLLPIFFASHACRLHP